MEFLFTKYFVLWRGKHFYITEEGQGPTLTCFSAMLICTQLWFCVNLITKVFTLRISAVASGPSAFFCCYPTSALKKILT